jgi:uncharacterized membrane protein YkvA (DUF1232 family)
MKIKTLSQATKIATTLFKNRDKIKDVFKDSGDKAEKNKEQMTEGLWSNVKTFRRMIKASLNGSFKPSKRTIIYLIAGLIYFISPLDMVPDFILGLGFLDDAAVLGIIAKRIKNELDRFKDVTNFDDVKVIL